MAEETTATTRQRKKRKWDQPAESVDTAAVPMSAMPSLMSFPGAGLGMFASLVGVFPSMAVSMPPVPFPMVPPAAPNSAAAAIVQKINQDLATKGLIPQIKIHDEVISREIIINDAEPGVRYKLTKRQTQEEIQAKTGAVVITRGQFRPPNGPVESEKPLYLHISSGVHLKDTAERIKSVDAAAALIEEMLKQGRVLGPLSAGSMSGGAIAPSFTTAVNVGLETDPSFNIIGRIRGPNDQYINHIMTETGATVVVRGRGSGNCETPPGEELGVMFGPDLPLHLFISADNPKSLDDARRLSENLLETIRSDSFSFRQPSYQLPAGEPALNFTSVPLAPQSTPAAWPPPMAYQQMNPPYPGPLGRQNQQATFYPSGYPPSPQVWPPAMAPPTGAEKTLQNPYANMLPYTKAYGAVPPPRHLVGETAAGANTSNTGDFTPVAEGRSPMQQNRGGVTTTGVESSRGSVAQPSFPAAPSTTTLVPGLSQQGQPQQGLSANHRPLTVPPYVAGAVNHLNHSLPRPALATSYSGYGGVYPQATPLQQVASALQRPPPPVSVRPGFGPAISAPLTAKARGFANNTAQTDRHLEKHAHHPAPKERRKFQEFPVAVKPTLRNESQLQMRQGLGSVQLHEPSRMSEAGQSISSLPSPLPKNMPPPPPKSMPPPPPRPIPRAPSVPSQPVKDAPGLKLVEYGEEEEEDSAGKTPSKGQLAPPPPYSNAKPFWAP